MKPPRREEHPWSAAPNRPTDVAPVLHAASPTRLEVLCQELQDKFAVIDPHLLAADDGIEVVGLVDPDDRADVMQFLRARLAPLLVEDHLSSLWDLDTRDDGGTDADAMSEIAAALFDKMVEDYPSAARKPAIPQAPPSATKEQVFTVRRPVFALSFVQATALVETARREGKRRWSELRKQFATPAQR